MNIRMIIGAALLVVSTAVITSVAAQDSGHQDPGMEAMTIAGTPGKMHKHLDAMAGEWTAKTRFWMEEGAPPMESDGTANAKWILDGRWMRLKFDSTMMGEKFVGRGYYGYDNLTKKYVSTWIDSMSTSMMHATGTADSTGKIFTFEWQAIDPMSGEMAKSRDIMTFPDHNTMTYTMNRIDADGNLHKGGEVIYTRVKK